MTLFRWKSTTMFLDDKSLHYCKCTLFLRHTSLLNKVRTAIVCSQPSRSKSHHTNICARSRCIIVITFGSRRVVPSLLKPDLPSSSNGPRNNPKLLSALAAGLQTCYNFSNWMWWVCPNLSVITQYCKHSILHITWGEQQVLCTIFMSEK